MRNASLKLTSAGIFLLCMFYMLLFFNVIHAYFCRELPGELVTVINHLKSILEADSRMAEAYLKILSAYGHPPPFRSRTFYQIWVSRLDK